MKGIELSIREDGQLEITCLEHGTVHSGAKPFCCTEIMLRAMSLGIQKLPEGYHARAFMGKPEQKDLTGVLFDIALAPLAPLFEPKGGDLIENKR